MLGLYKYDGISCSMVYYCRHEDPPGKSWFLCVDYLFCVGRWVGKCGGGELGGVDGRLIALG
jgi:hypothetical protein